MKFASALSTEKDSKAALADVRAQLERQLQGKPVSLAGLFLTQHHAEAFENISATLREILVAECFLGCTAMGVIGGEKEIENRAGLGVMAADLPGTKIAPFHLTVDEENKEIFGWPPIPPEGPSAFFLMADPFSSPAREILERINTEHPGSPILGGMASGGMSAGQNRLFLNDQILEQGAVGAVLGGGVAVRSVVSQGCRPIGQSFVVTQAEKNVIYTLGGKPALKVIQELFTSLSPIDQQLFRGGLHMGWVVDELKGNFQRGDFIVRNVIGMDQNSGAIAVGDYIRKGQTVQFHVRDADSADEDLRVLLEEAGKQFRPEGALLFSCNGRGVNLFGEPHHDVQTLQQVLGPLPTAGFFAQGEIGPVGKKNFLHGFTASIALFGQQK